MMVKPIEQIYKEFPTLNSVLIMKNDQMSNESYFNGYTSSMPQHLASVTKSIMSLLVGIAIDQGLIHSVEDKVLDYFPEHASHATMIQKSIRIKHLLTMTAPFAFSMKSMDGRPFEPLDRLRRQKDWVKYIISLMGKGNLTNRFQYSTPSTHLLSAVITKTSGQSARTFANENLFSPIGIDAIEAIQMTSFKLEDLFGEQMNGWVHDPQGINTGGWGIALIPRAMIQLGQLIMHEGQFKGQRVISKEWIESATKEQVEGYGYLWWIKEIRGFNVSAALGYGGNIIACIPKLDAIVVTTGQMRRKSVDPWALLDRIIQMILLQ
ncbi:serine hydrolase domain-containing protein [Fusibacter ferrireducens]|uniref:Serine hydrolase n=1 Tax=Fusibacter ferrireducens TaxID=2785058 RepID=A0ABR9ZYP8_9FIRM|nr:serine hydrolase [Fusibacter ferrireducens]MBF4695592.1 serine hydrolase [Fusibacter ferrireducens]